MAERAKPVAGLLQAASNVMLKMVSFVMWYASVDLDPPAAMVNSSGDTVAGMLVARRMEGRGWSKAVECTE